VRKAVAIVENQQQGSGSQQLRQEAPRERSQAGPILRRPVGQNQVGRRAAQVAFQRIEKTGNIPILFDLVTHSGKQYREKIAMRSVAQATRGDIARPKTATQRGN